MMPLAEKLPGRGRVLVAVSWIYVWRIRTRLPERKGERCRMIARGKLNSCLVEFPDGTRVVTSRWSLRKAPSGGEHSKSAAG